MYIKISSFVAYNNYFYAARIPKLFISKNEEMHENCYKRSINLLNSIILNLKNIVIIYFIPQNTINIDTNNASLMIFRCQTDQVHKYISNIRF